MSGEPFLQMTSISKSFGAVRALRAVDFEVAAGEVMALVGENGAGKSTLVKILAGIHRPDHGSIRIGGREVDLHTSARSQQAGIAVVQQELSLVPVMSVAENVFLGDARRRIVHIPGQLARQAAPLLELVGLAELDPGTLVERLSIAERQLVELARLVARDARILILDEPTAALSDAEIARVKRVVRALVAEGRAVIYVTHRLGEVFDLAQRVTVVRNGQSEPPVAVSGLTVERLVERMLGRPLGQMFPPRGSRFGETVLGVHQLSAAGLRHPVDLNVRAGEIVGLAGQLGSGATAVVQALGGASPLLDGQVRIQGQPVQLRTPANAIRAGIAYCSGDRKRDGLFGVRLIAENLTAPALERITPGGWLSHWRERGLARRLAQFFQIDQRRLGYPVRTLSGGNQQKVALGKWLGVEPKVLLVEEPTIGVDVGARAEIYAHLRRLADNGLAVVFASSDIQEVVGLADTIVTFYHGRLINACAAGSTDAARVLREVTHPDTADAGSAA